MKAYTGRTVCEGIAIGNVIVIRDREQQIETYRIEDANEEIGRLDRAVRRAREQLQGLYEKALKGVGEANAAIFEAHRIMLEDEDYLGAIQRMIRTELVNVEYAVAVTEDRFSEMFAGMKDDYMKARAEDVKDISGRLIRILQGRKEAEFSLIEPAIIVAEDLSPSETVQMDQKKILAFVTVRGSANSHAAILARTMNIPALTGVSVDLNGIHTGMTAIVDGAAGEVIFDPTEAQRGAAEKRKREEQEKTCLLRELRGKKSETIDGRVIRIYANIGSVSDVRYALENDAEGIGLFRSEFLYLGRKDFPSEEEQFQAYRKVLQAMGEKKVVIRTLDIGADKQAECFRLEREENPAMGYRAIRICLKQPELFKTQLRALLRAAVYGNLSIMYPMIISVGEVKQIYRIVEEAAQDLKQAQIPYRIPEQGIMIETPAAVMISDELAELVDFFSIGTNDLAQYTLAIDRQNQRLEDFYDPHHKAILRMIRMVVDNAHKCGKWVGICGELGADTELTREFLDMCVDELSVAPSMVLKIREKVREAEIPE